MKTTSLARQKASAGPMWPAGRTLPTPALECHIISYLRTHKANKYMNNEGLLITVFLNLIWRSNKSLGIYNEHTHLSALKACLNNYFVPQKMFVILSWYVSVIKCGFSNNLCIVTGFDCIIYFIFRCFVKKFFLKSLKEAYEGVLQIKFAKRKQYKILNI